MKNYKSTHSQSEAHATTPTRVVQGGFGQVPEDDVLRQNATAGPALRFAGVAIAATALIAICAHISLPLFFTPVPLTLQPFAVLLIGLLLTPRAAFAALALYLLEGAAGLPVFTPHGAGGALQILGPTGGYLLSYPLAAPLVSWLSRKYGIPRSGSGAFIRATGAAAVGNVVILALGSLWLWSLIHLPAPTLLMQSVLPFLPGDALKVVAAAAVATGIQKMRCRNDHPSTTI